VQAGKTLPAPIALFAYNRPLHTRRLVGSLEQNPEARSSDLYVFSDGARDASAEPAVREVRDFARGISGFRTVTIVERQHNLGLADSIIEGVTTLCERHGQVVVLEDDLVVSPHFLRFMSDSLSLYAEQPRVMHVSACAYPVKHSLTTDTYFLRVPLCWGWGTWDRAWRSYRRDLSLMAEFTKRMRHEFDFDGTYSYWQQLALNKSGHIRTWFVFWYAALYLSGGLALFPREPLAQNLGFDSTGVHCGATGVFDIKLGAGPVRVEPIPIVESHDAFDAHRRYFESISPSLAMRVRSRAAYLLRR
jgi:hypothetical protein